VLEKPISPIIDKALSATEFPKEIYFRTASDGEALTGRSSDHNIDSSFYVNIFNVSPNNQRTSICKIPT